MAFKMVLDSLDGLPEDVAKEYVEQDGKFVIQVEGMKTQADIDRLNTSVAAARTEAAGFKAKLAMLGDRKVEDVVAILERVPELEAAAEGKLDDEKINQLVEGRISGKLAPVTRERDAAKNRVTELEVIVAGFESKEKGRTIHDQVRKAAKAAGVLDEAVEDAIMLADRTFELQDDGLAVVKVDSGFTAGLQPKDWFADLQAKRPHWWPATQGGGAGGNRGGAGGGSNPWSHEGWNITEQGKIYAADKGRAESLSKAAGHQSPLGAMKPEPKK